MQTLASILVLLVAIEHVYILVLEMFLWSKPKGRKIFGMSEAEAESTKVLAGNQGLYNGFLAAGLFWSLVHPDGQTAWQLQVFFVSCVLVAGLYGGATANKIIYKVQALPAAMALLAVIVAGV